MIDTTKGSVFFEITPNEDCNYIVSGTIMEIHGVVK